VFADEKELGVFIPSRDESPGLTEPAAFGCSHQRAGEPLETFLFFQLQALCNSAMDSLGPLRYFSINRQNDTLDSSESLETDFSTPC